jgi:hypothetical protein
MRQKRGRDHHRTSNLKKMTMLTLRNAILSMRTRTRELSESALLSKNTPQMLGDILTNRVSTKHTNRYRELSVNHGNKELINRENHAMRRHKVNPGIVREIIYKNNIVSMTPFRGEGSWTPNI